MSVQALSSAFAIRGLTPSEKLVLLALANYADANLRCYPSHNTLSADTGLSERTILTVLKSLEEKQVLSREARRRGDGSRASDLITLCMCGEMVSPRGENDRQSKPQLTVVGGETISPHEPRTNLQIEEPRTEANASAADHPNKKAWGEATALLIALGGMTVSGARAFFGKLLSQHGLEASDLLGAIGEAEHLQTQDPKGFLTRAAQARARRRQATGPPKRVGFV